MATDGVMAERFGQGRTFAEYVAYAGSAENLAREAFGRNNAEGGSDPAPRRDNSGILQERYIRSRLSEAQAAAVRWLAAQPGGPAKILVISEDWSSDCRRDVPMLARLAETGGLELRIFNRDGVKVLPTRLPVPGAFPDSNHDLMARLVKRTETGEYASVPVAVVYDRDMNELYRYHEFPAIYHKDTVRARQNMALPGETPEQAADSATREFTAMQNSPFFDIWASAMVDEVLSGIFEKLVLERGRVLTGGE